MLIEAVENDPDFWNNELDDTDETDCTFKPGNGVTGKGVCFLPRSKCSLSRRQYNANGV